MPSRPLTDAAEDTAQVATAGARPDADRASDRPAPPDSLDGWRAVLATGRGGLSRRLAEVADWVEAHPESVAVDTLAQIAARAGTHPSTLVRFANHFGFGGFAELQRLYKRHVHEHFNDYGARIREAQASLARGDAGGPDGPDGPDGSGAADGARARNDPRGPGGLSAPRLLEEFGAANRTALEALVAGTDPDALERAVELLHGARAIHVCGIRRAFPVAMYFAYALPHVGFACHAIDGLGLMHAEQARCVRRGEVLVAITFAPYAQVTREVVATARAGGAGVILITDDGPCPSADDSDVLFAVRDAEVRSFRSLNSSLCLAQTLCIALGYRREGVIAAPADRGASPPPTQAHRS